MSLHERFLFTIECPKCGRVHKFSFDGVLEKGTIYCGCDKTIIIDNANQYGKIINELEKPSYHFALSTKAEKKEEIESEEEKPKTAKPKSKDTNKKTTKKPKKEKPKT
jgi:hypothetical protein